MRKRLIGSLQRVFLFLSAILASYLLSYVGHHVPSGQAQTAVTNQAGAVFGPPGQQTSISSNETRFQTPEQPALSITKTADRAAAEPGDVVLYRLLIQNTGASAATLITVADQLPLGLTYIDNSVRAASEGVPVVPTAVAIDGNRVVFQFDDLSLGANQRLEVVYAALLTPDAIRGSGQNVAQVSAPGLPPSVAVFQLTIRAGILSDCGTIIGRVFVDKNFDGEQQPGEAGVPNAVIFLDDGNRIITDPEGLFSIANVVSGNRVGTLDLSSLPGYTLAPNLYRIENNSQSRLARLAPGGLARMNFAVTPTFGEEES
ncbi:MAG: DUF11 domain-containing protein [Leptolyngbyaceae cyanobacterium RM1_1_2]|nr:DUF11 domain-containing protein [Leptolyngbyaceae cyanobacterium RM1_1_2]